MTTPTTITLATTHDGQCGRDMLQDIIADVGTTSGRMRDRNMTAAIAAGLPPCECCWKGVDVAKATRVVDSDGNHVAYLGPECTRKIRAALAAG